MDRTIALINKLFAWLRQHWWPIFLLLVPACLLVIPYSACYWSDAVLIMLYWLIVSAFIALVLVGSVALFTPATRAIFRRQVRLFMTLKYSVFFGLLLVGLPLTACPQFPLHNLVGGLFQGLDAQIIALVAGAMFVAIWSLAFTQGLTIDTIEVRFRICGRAQTIRNDRIKRKHYISMWAYEFFNSYITPRQFSAYFLIALIGLGVLILYAQPGIWVGLLAALVGLIGGFLFVDLITSLAVLFAPADETYQPLPFSLFREPLRKFVLPRLGYLWPKFLAGIELIGKWCLPLKYLEKTKVKTNKMAEFLFPELEHGVAFVVGLGMLLFPIWFGWISSFDPMGHALPHIYFLIIILILFFSGLDFLFARIHVSFLLVLTLWAFIGYSLLGIDHYYYIDQVETQKDQALSAIDVAKGSGEKNLVIVTSAGGGIWAAGWTTVALKGLISERPELLREIRVISGVSGGAVGAANFIYDLCRSSEGLPLSTTDQARFLTGLHQKSLTSSLSAVTYGFTYFDSFRLLSGGLINPKTDRAFLQEEQWAKIARGEVTDEETEPPCHTLLDLREGIRRGWLPAPIFSATIMETGRRVMITPVNFDLSDPPGAEIRADTLSELLFGEWPANQATHTEVDLNLWTAARLSAAFPYVTPAARARLNSEANLVDPFQNKQVAGYHLVDGGYYDNFGVTSALDWLQPVLQARLKGKEGLDFTRVVIIELRAFPVPARLDDDPEPGWTSAIIGPPIGLYNIRNGSALSRNEIEMARFMELWNGRFRLKNMGVEIKRFTIEPPTKTVDGCAEFTPDGPLSWDLTQNQKDDLDKKWECVVQSEYFKIMMNSLKSSDGQVSPPQIESPAGTNPIKVVNDTSLSK